MGSLRWNPDSGDWKISGNGGTSFGPAVKAWGKTFSSDDSDQTSWYAVGDPVESCSRRTRAVFLKTIRCFRFQIAIRRGILFYSELPKAYILRETDLIPLRMDGTENRVQKSEPPDGGGREWRRGRITGEYFRKKKVARNHEWGREKRGEKKVVQEKKYSRVASLGSVAPSGGVRLCVTKGFAKNISVWLQG